MAQEEERSPVRRSSVEEKMEGSLKEEQETC